MSKDKKAQGKKVKEKKAKLKDLNVIDAVSSHKAEFRSLDEIVGETQNLFGCNSVESYEDKINAMDMADLQEHAVDLDLRPIDNRTVLKERLTTEFRKRLSRYNSTAVYEETTIYDHPDSAELKKLLAGGR